MAMPCSGLIDMRLGCYLLAGFIVLIILAIFIRILESTSISNAAVFHSYDFCYAFGG